MIGIWRSYARVYLYVAALGMLVSFGIPLLLAPIWWARRFGWPIPQPDHMIAFLGRSLGGLICVLAGAALKAARTPAVRPFFFDLLLWMFFIMIVVHVYGALRGMQPVTETLEIAAWILLFLATLGFYPSQRKGGSLTTSSYPPDQEP